MCAPVRTGLYVGTTNIYLKIGDVFPPKVVEDWWTSNDLVNCVLEKYQLSGYVNSILGGKVAIDGSRRLTVDTITNYST